MNSNSLRWLSRVLVGTEQMTLYVRSGTGANPTTGGLTLYRVKRQNIAKENFSPELGQSQLAFIITQPDLDNASAAAPKVDDVLADANGVRWTILRMQYRQMQQAYECSCIKERP